MGDLRALKAEFVTPEVVLESLAKEMPNLEQLYVVGIDKDKEPIFWATGDLAQLAFAALVFQSYAFKFLHKEIVPEFEK